MYNFIFLMRDAGIVFRNDTEPIQTVEFHLVDSNEVVNNDVLKIPISNLNLILKVYEEDWLLFEYKIIAHSEKHLEYLTDNNFKNVKFSETDLESVLTDCLVDGILKDRILD